MPPKPKHSSRAHASLSPSAAHQWMNCAAAPRLWKQAPVPGESPYAKEGTAAHELCQIGLTEGVDKLAGYLGKKIKLSDKPGDDWLVDQEMVDCAMRYCLWIEDFLLDSPGIEMHVEEKVQLNPDVWGTSDFIGIRGVGLPMIVADFKYGKGVAVEVRDNEQLAIYAAAARKKFGLSCAVDAYIFQPRQDDPIRHWHIPAAELDAWEVKVENARKATKKKDAQAIAGNHCRWCRAKPICTAQKLLTEEVVFGGELVTFDAFVPEAHLPTPDTLSLQQLRKVLTYGDCISNWIEQVVSYVKEGIVSGKIKPEEVGHKVIEGRSSRTWKDDVIFVAQELKRLGVQDPFQKKLKGITEVEKEIGKNKVGHLTVKPSGKPSLVPMDDARPAITNSSQIVFDAYTN